MDELLHNALLVPLDVLDSYFLLEVCILELVHLQPESVALFRCLLLLPEIELVNLVCLVLALLELLLEYLAVEAISKLILVSLLL